MEKSKVPLNVGGQAVIEGVMMRSPWRVATAVRDPEGSIQVKSFPFVSLARRNKIVGLPIIRGAVGLFEALRIGMDTLNWSAEIAGQEDSSKPGIWDKVLSFVFTLVALAAGVGLFMAVPYFVAGLFESTGDNQIFFHLIAGSLRIVLLIGYMAAISLIPDIKRVFQYHGAEHKSIFTFEKKLELTNYNAICQSRFHPRCGTSFILLAAIMTMIGFMLLDSTWVHFLGAFTGVFHRILVHLPLIPLVAGISYEFLRIIEKHSDSPAWRPFVVPGFLLQRITTREPDESQVEVALAALNESLLKSEDSYEGLERNKQNIENPIPQAS